jgi:hypothetical protein
MDWWTVLQAVRKASLDGKRPFTALDVSREAKIEATERSRPEQLASAWLGKFHRWGYVLPDGSAKGEKRWVRTFTITEYGLKRPEPGPSPEWKQKKK